MKETKYVSFEKMSKKAQREVNASRRTRVMFNTGTRIQSTAKHLSRAQRKAQDRKNAEY